MNVRGSAPITGLAILLALVPATGRGDTVARPRLGAVEFRASCNEEAQRRFTDGLALLHHMMYDQAGEEFIAARRADAGCAMARWGEAMSLVHPLWPDRASPEDFRKGAELLEEAARDTRASPRERAYIQAARALFDGEGDEPARIARWHVAMEDLHRSDPDDVDAAAFYALSLLAVADPADKSLGRQRTAAEVIERVHESAPLHPGVIHYAIHAFDFPGLADRGARFAGAYCEIAPDVPHALHMPSHIYVRLGRWPETVEWNLRSAAAAARQPVGDYVSQHYVHAMDYLTYAWLQLGEDDAARDLVARLAATSQLQPSFNSAYALAAIPARVTLETGDWEGAAALPVRQPATVPWDRFPGAEAITHFGRAIGATRLGRLDDARSSVAEMRRIESRASEIGEGYWRGQIEIQRLAAEAWIAHAEGRQDDAVRLAREAAEKESRSEKNPVTPGVVFPAAELLAELYLKLDRPGEAVAAYEMSLASSPRRWNALAGAAEAARRAGMRSEAKRFHRELAALIADGTHLLGRKDLALEVAEAVDPALVERVAWRSEEDASCH